MMKFQHRFRVDAPLSEVLEFHSLSSSMGAITPPQLLPGCTAPLLF
jgi:ligand-binding SRPBCC domain-containing protein